MSAELPFVEAVTAMLSETTVKGTLILALAGLVTTWGMRRAAAATRHLVWSGAVACVLMLPLLRTVVPRWAVTNVSMPAWALPTLSGALAASPAPPTPSALAASAVPDATPAIDVAADPVRAASAVQRAVMPVVAPPASVDRFRSEARSIPDAGAAGKSDLAVPPSFAPSTRADAPRRSLDLSPLSVLLIVWATGAALVLSRLLVGTVALARLARQSTPCDDARFIALLQSLRAELGIRRPVTLLVGGADAVPMTWGVVYPKVLLPPDASTWSDGRRRAVLLHELAHVERFDTLTHIVSQVAVAVLWFHPLAIIASRRLRAERERACDDLVLAAGGVRATAYANDLLEFVGTMKGSRAIGAGLAMARRSEFEGRLLSILDPSAPRARTSKRRTLAATLLVAVAALPLAGLRGTAEAAEAGVVANAGVPARLATAPETESTRDSLATDERRNTDSSAADSSDSASTDGVMPELPVLPGVVVSTSMAEYDGGLTAAARAKLAQRIAALDTGRQRLVPDVRPAPGAASLAVPAAGGGVRQEPLPAAVIADFARAVAGMTSDSDKAAVLLKLAPRAGESGDIRNAFFGSMRGMTSDSEARRVLVGVLKGTINDSTVAAVLDAVRRMTSDTQRAAVLTAVVEKRRLSSSYAREKFFLAVEGLTSESMRESVLLALLRAEPQNEALYLPTINAAAKITSERQQGNVLLAIAATTPALRDAETRARFLDALGKLTSSSEYRRVMDAMVR